MAVQWKVWAGRAELELARVEALALRGKLDASASTPPHGTEASETTAPARTRSASPQPESRAHERADRQQLLQQISVAKEEEARVRRRLQALEHEVAAGEQGVAKGVLLARDVEVKQLREMLERLRESEALTKQALARAEVRKPRGCDSSPLVLCLLTRTQSRTWHIRLLRCAGGQQPPARTAYDDSGRCG